MASSTCKEFYRVGPERYEATRMWWNANPSMTDPQAHILQKLIQLKGRNKVKDALAFNVLKQKYMQDENWRCRSCGQCYLCCFLVKEDVDRTVRGRAREQDDTEDDRQRQRARVQGDEPAEDDGEFEARATAQKPNDFAEEEDASVMNAMVATADPIPYRAREWQGVTPTEATDFTFETGGDDDDTPLADDEVPEAIMPTQLAPTQPAAAVGE